MNTSKRGDGARLTNVHPGEILDLDYLTPLKITPRQLSQAMRVAPTRIAAILAGRCSITADTALRLSRVLGTSAELWLGLQQDYDLEEELRTERKELAALPLLVRPTP